MHNNPVINFYSPQNHLHIYTSNELGNNVRVTESSITFYNQEAAGFKPLIELLVSALAPARIYKIEHKDIAQGDIAFIHLLLVMPGSCTVPFTEMEPVLELASLKDCRVSCSLVRFPNLESATVPSKVFYRRFLIPENLVYDNGETTMPEQDDDERKALNDEVRKRFKTYIAKAYTLYERADSLADIGTEAVTAFLLHQATELGFRSILEMLNGYCKKSHSIRCLKKQARRCAPQLYALFPDNTPAETELLDFLEGAYSPARYDVKYSVEEHILEPLRERVKCFLDTAAKVFEMALAE